MESPSIGQKKKPHETKLKANLLKFIPLNQPARKNYTEVLNVSSLPITNFPQCLKNVRVYEHTAYKLGQLHTNLLKCTESLRKPRNVSISLV